MDRGVHGSAADECQGGCLESDRAQSIQAVGQPAEHALDSGAGEVFALRGGERHAEERRGGIGQVGGALAFEVRLQHEAIGSGGGGEGEASELIVVDAEEACDAIEHSCGVEGGDQRQVGSGCVREAGDSSARVGRRHRRYAEHRAAGADRDDGIAGRDAETEATSGVVTGARPDRDPSRDARGGHSRRFCPDFERIQHPRKDGVMAEGSAQQFPVVGLGACTPVAGTTRIGGVGHERGKLGPAS